MKTSTILLLVGLILLVELQSINGGVIDMDVNSNYRVRRAFGLDSFIKSAKDATKTIQDASKQGIDVAAGMITAGTDAALDAAGSVPLPI